MDSNEFLPVENLKLNIWSYFDKHSDSIVQCKLCHHRQKYHGNTANLSRHIKNNHCINLHLKETEAIHKTLDEEQEFQLIVEDQINAHNLQERKRHIGKNACTSMDKILDPYNNTMNEYVVGHVDANELTNRSIKYRKGQHNDNPEKILTKSSNENTEEQHVLAEIAYFREKAAYYRHQSNLVALRVKKFKKSLDASLR